MVHIITADHEKKKQRGWGRKTNPATPCAPPACKPSKPIPEIMADLAMTLKQRFPNIASVLHGIREHPAQFAIAERITVLAGNAALRESINGLSLSMSGDAFFQTNPGVTPLLHDVIRNMADLSGTEHVLELFCGTGAIGLSLAASCRMLTGIESVPGAVRDAMRNARANNIANAAFLAADATAFMKQCAAHGDKRNHPDIVVADPPRAGLGKELVKALLAVRPAKLILISCDAATLARDLCALIKGGYTLQRIQALDMFPHTPHMECCCLLKWE